MIEIRNKEKPTSIWLDPPSKSIHDIKIERILKNMGPATYNYSDPSESMQDDKQDDKMWNAIWDEIKTWDINVPYAYSGYCGATGNHVTAIYKAIHNRFAQQETHGT